MPDNLMEDIGYGMKQFDEMKKYAIFQMENLIRDKEFLVAAINAMQSSVHERNVAAGWWTDLATGERKERNVGELLCLIHSEVSEGLEGYRKNLMDTHLPHRPMLEVEMADTIIRIFDLCGGLGLDLGGAYVEKLAYNAKRLDHKREARKADNGKKI